MDRQAIDIALDMVCRPFLIREVQQSPLPPGVFELIRLAAGSDSELAEAGKTRRRDPNVLRQAAVFFLQQALLFPGADSHRILGLTHAATAEQIRDHKRLLLKWLHPDRNPSSWEQMLFQRVITAAADLNQRLNDPPTSAIANPAPRRQRSRSRVHRLPAVRHRQASRWQPRLRAYVRRTAIATILLTLTGSGWRLVTGEWINLSFVQLHHTAMGWFLW